MTDWASLRYAAVDVEGNGQQPLDLVELATVPIVGGIIGEPVSWLVKPDIALTRVATRIHGLSDKDVARAPAFAKIKNAVLDALDGAVLVAHNAHVDVDVLRRKLPDWKTPEVFHTLKLARRLVPGLDSYRLGALVKTYKLDDELPDRLTPHRAVYDAVVTARLFVRLATSLGAGSRSLEVLRGDPAGGIADETPALF
jgi:exodeoxyribonuclease X